MSKTPDRRPSYDELAALVVRQMATIEAQRETIAQLEETVDRLTIRSYLDSARKHGLSAFDAIHRAFTGNLWMPPVAFNT